VARDRGAIGTWRRREKCRFWRSPRSSSALIVQSPDSRAYWCATGDYFIPLRKRTEDRAARINADLVRLPVHPTAFTRSQARSRVGFLPLSIGGARRETAPLALADGNRSDLIAGGRRVRPGQTRTGCCQACFAGSVHWTANHFRQSLMSASKVRYAWQDSRNLHKRRVEQAGSSC